MEPQLEGCGKVRPDRLEAYAGSLLQWSRNLRVAERRVYGLKGAPPALLQWSRNLRVAESAGRERDGNRHRLASMEPQLEGCGKRHPLYGT